jgi:serine/threonine protein kinase
LHEELGHGGNATVWRANRGGDAAVALKVINTKKAEREPYQRFVREINFLLHHQDVPGLLPVLDAHLPESPVQGDVPWLAMPIAVPIARALADRPLSAIVQAVAAIADTLVRLQEGPGIGHRDIKPGNLYELDGAWLIGDFGLIAVPDASGLTANGRPLGPAHFTAYEMILDPAGADPHPADVYSLGKTLWVLATGLAFPPEGHQAAGTRKFGIADFRAHPHADALDRLVDQMTVIHPEQRPSKSQVARDLHLWSALATEPVILDVSEVRAQLRSKLESQLAEEDLQAQRKELALASVRRLQDLTRPLNEALKTVHPKTQIDSQSDELTQNVLRSHPGLGDREMTFRWQRCTIVAPFEHGYSIGLRMARSVELRDDGELLLHLMVDVGILNAAPSMFHWQSEGLSAPVGSVESDSMIELGVAHLAKAVDEGLRVLVERLPDRS